MYHSLLVLSARFTCEEGTRLAFTFASQTLLVKVPPVKVEPAPSHHFTIIPMPVSSVIPLPLVSAGTVIYVFAQVLAESMVYVVEFMRSGS